MASYKDAIQWIVDNDDTSDMGPHEGVAAVFLPTTAFLVVDLFNKTPEQVWRDIMKAKE